MSDPVARYQEAIAKVEASEAKAKSVVAIVVDAGRKLGKWQDVMVNNAGDGVGYPAEMGLNANTPTINAHTWPSANDIHEALSAYHVAKSEAMHAWVAIPADRKKGLNPPA